jgi:hypothetical protein
MARGRARRRLTPLDFERINSPEFREAFWAKVDKSGPCWLWTGPIVGKGYGAAQVRGHKNPFQGHVIVAFWKYGRWMEEHEETRHACGTRLCMNPDHLAYVVYTISNAA